MTLHASQAMQGLRAGKHVYSAVPTGIAGEEIRELVEIPDYGDPPAPST